MEYQSRSDMQYSRCNLVLFVRQTLESMVRCRAMIMKLLDEVLGAADESLTISF